MKDMFGDLSPGVPIELRDRDQTILMDTIDHSRARYPYCIVWTPIPVLTWLFPFLGHMGICMSNGIIRDFAGPYFVSEDLMAFGNPTKYWQLSPQKASNGPAGWDAGVIEASEIYKKRMHIIFYDNCHSHVATALNTMNYGGCKNWNMVKLAFYMIPYSKYVSFAALLKTWLPFCLIASFICGLAAII
ncbi:transmembrane protein 222 [Pieris napi]|uniref:transmembrane protein 222 n=1 Tax=Pieris napi TaxID=78633 RepID=UPI001FBA7AA4|nr:transmembrane protein 222 [Pieris napi]XP_047503861.1 transmembrane protein 222 [Pieris napi]XP_047503862.1 transmembrane protein 222 [Pieris napi]